MAPMALGLSAVQINTFADTMIAYLFVVVDGERVGPAVLGFAQVLYQLPLGVFGISLATAIFPLMSQEALKPLMQYDWPGNVRQLENVLEMAIILAGERDYLLPEDLPPLCRPPEPDFPPRVEVPPEGVDLNRLVSQFEKALIEEGLRQAHGRRSQAALLLGLKRTTLLEKLKRLEAVSA